MLPLTGPGTRPLISYVKKDWEYESQFQRERSEATKLLIIDARNDINYIVI